MVHQLVEQYNSQISYADGKIKWECNKGYTSETMKHLYRCGYRASVSGCVHTLYDMKNKKVTSAYSWEGLRPTGGCIGNTLTTIKRRHRPGQ